MAEKINKLSNRTGWGIKSLEQIDHKDSHTGSSPIHIPGRCHNLLTHGINRGKYCNNPIKHGHKICEGCWKKKYVHPQLNSAGHTPAENTDI